MKKIFFITVLLIFGIVGFGFGQSVDLATGAPSVYIPIWTATSGSLSLPIGLSYNVNGVGVAELPTEVGTSWKLNAGGTITQIIRQPNSSITRTVEDEDGNKIDHNSVDLYEPSYFQVDINGRSYQFYQVKNTESYISITTSNIKMEMYYNENNEVSFKIIDDTGIIYYFDELVWFTDCSEDVPINSNMMFDYTVSNKWLLTKIESPNKIDIIEFTYLEPYNFRNGYKINRSKKENINSDWDEEYEQKHETFFEIIRLETITTKNYSVKFIYEESDYFSCNLTSTLGLCFDETFEITDKEELLKNIQIINNYETVLKNFTFEYKYENYRSFLKKIIEFNNENDFLPLYVFEYFNGLYFINEEIGNCDFWGFYNNFNGFTYNYTDRFPDGIGAKYGMLKSIYYDKGNEVTFNYEPNYYSMIDDELIWKEERWEKILIEKYGENVALDELIGPGVRVKNIKFSDGISVYFENYEYADGRLTQYPVIEYEAPDNKRNYLYSFSYLLNFDTPMLYYEKVTKYTTNAEGVNTTGNIEYYFSVEPDASIVNDDSDDFVYPIKENQKFNGLLIKTIAKDKDGKEINETENHYYSYINEDVNFEGNRVLPTSDDLSTYIQVFYTICQKGMKLDYSTQKSYDDYGNNITTSVEYDYDNFNRIITETTVDANGKKLQTVYYYPGEDSFTGNIYQEMIELNMISTPLKVENYIEGVLVSGEATTFRKSNDKIVPWFSQIYDGESWRTVEYYDYYDDDLNLIQSHTYDDIYSSIIYGYNNTLPIATVTNAGKDQIYYEGFEEHPEGFKNENAKTGNYYFRGKFEIKYPVAEGNYILTYWKKDNGIWGYREKEVEKDYGNYSEIIVGEIDEIRIHPVDAYMTTTTYEPLVGVTSTTDANNNTTYYKYDAWGRVVQILDMDKNIIKKYEYNFMKPIEFSIRASEEEVISGEEFTLTAVKESILPLNDNEITWEWYIDSPDNELYVIGQSANFNLCKLTNIYLRAIYANSASSYVEYCINPKTELQVSENYFEFYSYPSSNEIDINYIGCDLKLVLHIDRDWLDINYDENTNKIYFTIADDIIFEYNQPEIAVIYCKDNYSEEEIIIKTYPELEIRNHNYIINEINQNIYFEIDTRGGKTDNISYNWYQLNDSGWCLLNSEEDNIIIDFNGDTTTYKPIKCEITDGYTTLEQTWSTLNFNNKN